MPADAELAELTRLRNQAHNNYITALAARNRANDQYQQLALVRDAVIEWAVAATRQRNSRRPQVLIGPQNWSTEGGPAEIARARLSAYYDRLSELVNSINFQLDTINARLNELSIEYWESDARAASAQSREIALNASITQHRTETAAAAASANANSSTGAQP